MAFETAAGLASFDLVSGQRVPSVTPLLYDMIYAERDRAFLSRIADGPAVDEVQYSWWERPLRPQTVQDSGGGLTAGATSLTVVSGHGARIVVGAVLMDEADQTERIIVTAIAGDVLTIERGYGATTATAHAANAKFRVVALPAQEDSTTGLDLLRAPTEFKNYTEIFRRDLKASRSSQGVKTYSGYTLNAKRLQEKLVEIRDELEQAALFGVKNATTPAGSDTQLRTTGGLFQFVTNVDSTPRAGQVSSDIKDLVDAAAKELIEKGGDPNFVMAGGNIFGALMDLDADQIRYVLNDGMRGAQVSAIRTKYGPVVELVYDRWLLPTYLCVGDYRKVQMRTFSNGGTPHIEQLAKVSDGDRMMIIGELGFQIENGADAFKVYSAISVA